MPLPADELIRRIVAVELMTAEELRTFASGLPNPSPAEGLELARELVRAKRLTAYQAKALLQEKARSLVLGNYLILDKLGQGGMGAVFKAQHRRMKRVVALKVMAPALLKQPDLVKRFQREVEAAARLDHPNIVTAFDADQAGPLHFLVMQFIDGTDLSALVKSRGPLPADQAVDCILQAARGLQYAHAQGVVHRDIKPANLLLDRAGNVKVLDMGLARLADTEQVVQAELTSSGAVLGTVDYMSPEQALNTKHADGRSDIYSLGITLWYLLTGRAAYPGETITEKLVAHREQPIPSLTEACPAAPEGLEAIFRRMVAKKPADRYATVQELIADLELVRAGHAVSGPLLVETEEGDELTSFLASIGGGLTKLGAQRTAPATRATQQTVGAQTATADTLATASPTSASASTASGRRPWRNWTTTQKVALAVGTTVVAALLTTIALLVTFQPPRTPNNSVSAPVSPAAPATGATSGATSHPVVSEADEPQRKLAQLIFSKGGTVFVRGSQTEVKTAADLPRGRYEIAEVHLAGAQLTEDDLRVLGAVKTIRALHLNNANLADEDLRQLTDMESLQQLELPSNPRIGGAGLSHLQKLPKLTKLNLAGAGTDDQGLAELAKLTALETVNLDDAKIGDAGMSHLKALSRLKSFGLANTAVTDQGLTHLHSLPLTECNLRGTSVTAGGMLAFRRAVTSCAVACDFGTFDPLAVDPRSFVALAGADYQRLFNEWVPLGYRPLAIRAHAVDGQVRYDLTLARFNDEAAWQAKHNQPALEFQQIDAQLKRQGYVNAIHTSTLAGSAEIHAGLWEIPTPTFQSAAQIPTTGHALPGAGLDEFFLNFVRTYDLPGMSVAVAKEGKLLYARGFGYADVEQMQPVQPTSLFRIAGVSQTLTATAILRLAEQGKLKLDDRMVDLLPVAPPSAEMLDQRWKQVTVRQLLHHAAGLGTVGGIDLAHRSAAWASALGIPSPPTPDRVIPAMLTRRLDSAPGRWQNSSAFGYILLARVVEKESGRSYEDYVREEVLRPLGITRMQLGRTRLSDRAPQEVRYYTHETRLAVSAFPDDATSVPRPYGEFYLEGVDGASGWLASAVDLARFASASDEGSSPRVLSPESLQAMFAPPPAPLARDTAGNLAETYFGLGWSVRPMEGPNRINAWTLNSLPGSSSLLVRWHDGYVWSILINCDNTLQGGIATSALAGAEYEAIKAVKQWPEGDLFGSFEEK